MKKKIGLIGGAFDPIHEGHLQICDILINDFDVNEVWFILSYAKEKATIETPVSKRLQMLRKTIKSRSYPVPIRIKDFEFKQKKFVPTIKTLKYFKKKNPDFSFLFALGSDHIHDINKWQGFQNVYKYAKIVCFPRQGYSIKGQINNILLIKGVFAMNSIVDVSSSDIREGKKIHHLDRSTLEYILKNKLYIKNWVKIMLNDDQKYEHSIRVARNMKKYAKIHDLNMEEAYLSGLVHDVCRTWSIERLAHYIHLYDKSIKVFLENGHQHAGALFVKYEWGITNDVIFNAIASHTTGNEEMFPLAKLLFILDKWDSRAFKKDLTEIEKKKLKHWLDTNIDKAFLLVFSKILKWLETKKDANLDLLNRQKAIYNFHLNKEAGKKYGKSNRP